MAWNAVAILRSRKEVLGLVAGSVLVGYDASLRGDRFLTLRQRASWNYIDCPCPVHDVLRCNRSLHFAFIRIVLHCTLRIRGHVLSVRMNAVLWTFQSYQFTAIHRRMTSWLIRYLYAWKLGHFA